MNLYLPDGKEFMSSDIGEVKEYLSGLMRRVVRVSPDETAIVSSGRNLSLYIEGKTIPIRTSFFRKLMKWFNFPLGQIRYLDVETVASVMNDYLLNIKSQFVDITIENGEALSITSENFGMLNDEKLISMVEPLGITKVIINDYMTAIISEEKEKIEPFPGDSFGAGISIFNSDTGFRAFTINTYLLRYVCSNGAYVKDENFGKKYYHYNLDIEELYDGLKNSIDSLKEKKEIITERIKMLKEQTNFEETKKRIADIIKMRIGKYKSDKLFEDTREINNNYDLFNHITLKAKEFGSSNRIMLEEIAGELLFMN